MKHLTILTVAFAALIFACKKEEPDNLPVDESHLVTYTIYTKSGNFYFQYKGSDRNWKIDSVKSNSYTKSLMVNVQDYQFFSMVKNSVKSASGDSVVLKAESAGKSVSSTVVVGANEWYECSVQLSQLK